MIIDKFIAHIAKESKTVISKDSAYGLKLLGRIQRLLNDKKFHDTIETKLSDLRNWTGTYSEILMISLLKELDLPIRLEKKLSQKQTLLGINNYALTDIYLEQPYNLYFEVKRFNGVNKEITDNIISAVTNSTKVWRILANYQYDTFFNKGTSVVSREINDLKEAVNKGLNNYHSKNYTSLSYTIYRDKVDMTTSLHSYNAYRFAEEFKYFVFNHANQILKKKSNILSFVLSPKFNYSFTNGFDLDIGFRALSRRVFMELTKDNRKISELSDKWSDCDNRVFSIAKRITAIIFYVDGIDKKDKVFFYENPNVYKSNQEKTGMRQLKMEFDYDLKDKEFYYDNFEYDTY